MALSSIKAFISRLRVKIWEISGTLVFNKGDGLLRQWAASDVFYDRKLELESICDDHRSYSGEIKKDLRF